jgi:hypothetical protein
VSCWGGLGRRIGQTRRLHQRHHQYLACVFKKNERHRAARLRDEQDEARQRAELEEAMALGEATALTTIGQPAVVVRRREEALLAAQRASRYAPRRSGR